MNETTNYINQFIIAYNSNMDEVRIVLREERPTFDDNNMSLNGSEISNSINCVLSKKMFLSFTKEMNDVVDGITRAEKKANTHE